MMRRIAGEALDPDFLEFLCAEAGVTGSARACVLMFNGLRSIEGGKRVLRTAQALQLDRSTVYAHLAAAEVKMRQVLDEWRREREDDGRSLIQDLVEEIVPNLPRINPPSPEFAPDTYGEMQRIRMPKAKFPSVDDFK
jgi:hypothetical protein